MYFKKDVIEPKFSTVPPKPLHPIFGVLLLAAILMGLVALLGFEFKYHLIIDLVVVFWVVTLHFSEIITFTFLNIIVGLISILVSVGFELIWFVVYKLVI